MNKFELEQKDYDLIEYAKQEFQKGASPDIHGVAAAIRLKSGKMRSGLVLEAEVPSLTICAEPIVIGSALQEIQTDPITEIVAVRLREPGENKVIPPCGRCREFITDYAPNSLVIIFDKTTNQLFKVAATDLLPFKYEAMP